MAVEIAQEVTREKLQDMAIRSKVAAIETSEAMIEFDLQGNIRSANDNFLRAMGYVRFAPHVDLPESTLSFAHGSGKGRLVV